MITFRFLLSEAVLVAFLFAVPGFADSISLSNLETFSIPFGNGVDNVSINDNGDIAGTFSSSPGQQLGGFVIPGNGSPPFQINVPGAQQTFVNGINNQSTVVGYYLGADNLPHGFTYSGGTFTPTTAGPSFAAAINNAGDITGTSYNPATSAYAGFFIRNGVETTFQAPVTPGLRTFPSGINDLDQIAVGIEAPVGRGVYSGFLRQPDGSFQSLDFAPAAINNSGVIVGTGLESDIVKIGASEFTYEFPGAIFTSLEGINNQNEVVGIYDTSNDPAAERIFEGTLQVLATPEPATGWLSAASMFLIVLWARARRPRITETL